MRYYRNLATYELSEAFNALGYRKQIAVMDALGDTWPTVFKDAAGDDIPPCFLDHLNAANDAKLAEVAAFVAGL